MKITKKLTAIAMTFAMVLALLVAPAMSASAADDDLTITITANDDDKETHSYEAYQVFAGTVTKNAQGSEVLTGIEWGEGVNGTAILAALKADTTLGTAMKDCTSAEDVANVLKEYSDKSPEAYAFADIVGANLVTAKAVAGDGNTITVPAAGYYMVKDKDGSLNGKEDAAYTRFILEVLSSTTTEAKEVLPTLDKKIKVGEDTDVVSSASIGDEVEYVLTSKVPDMSGYDTYYFIVNDTMSKGLTYNSNATATVDGSDAAITVTPSTDADGVTTLKIVFNNFYNSYKNNAGADIVITYTATLNSNAVIGEKGNPNTASLTYSNDPNYDYDGNKNPDNPDEPNPEDPKAPTGKTPEKTVVTYTSGIKLTKVDGADHSKKLAGAKFSISGTAMKVVLVNEETYKEDASGTYYRLVNGTYTTTAPTSADDKNYDGNTKYSKVTVTTKQSVPTDFEAEGYVDANGVITFKGLNAGDYTITELVAPEGYNKIKPFTVNVGIDSMDTTSCTWKTTTTGASVDNGLIALEVENKQGIVLPSTGGMGTTIFYILGGILVVGAAVLLITRKRMAVEK